MLWTGAYSFEPFSPLQQFAVAPAKSASSISVSAWPAIRPHAAPKHFLIGKRRLANTKILNTKAYICQRRANKKEEGETTMDQDSLNELEAAMLKKRLKFLRIQGATGKLTHRLGDDFFKQMEDHWTFCSALADIYAVKEMGDQRRDDAVAATLPSSPEQESEDEDNETLKNGELLARLVVEKLLADIDADREPEESADRSDV
jgi:hypothetical protein